MKLDINGQSFEFNEDEFAVMFPLHYRDKRLVVAATMTSIDEEEVLSHYSCGDILNELNQLMASADCDAAPTHRLTMEILIETEGEEKIEMGTCTAISCQEHAFVGMLQVLFMSGLITSYKLDTDGNEQDTKE